MQAKRRLVKGNEAIALGAVAGGCDAFFGYPITPQNEVPEILSQEMPRHGRVFLQAESEVASINMVYGAAAAGMRAMSSSSSPGISLMMEGMSYIAGAELPCLVVNVMRGGPGLGSITPSQADYFQACKGGGHGDYRCFVMAPWNVQEMYSFPGIAFEMADRYRNPAMILADGVLGQMMEPAAIPDELPVVTRPDKPWATNGRNGRGQKNVANSLVIDPYELRDHNRKLQAKYAAMQAECKWDTRLVEDAEILVVAYGIAARLAYSACKLARKRGIRAGLFRPITLFPFPTQPLVETADGAKSVLAVELSSGQMVEDVRLAINGRLPVTLYGEMGGVIPSPSEVCDRIVEAAK
ncbi:MAG TPA: 3-methyl-2-oxobutanoate dehydrogenase subunit VorB [Phycisphaerae bacterium]|nr:3-methyl-2-oxobutanoate dehydrogenase subunit VorB [Phycisphaerales bacterium]HRX84811.1 3-methyl-2-oxobutanoate dehydrogenase subunit VorB [Phycisphaerae bacterium]